MATLGSLKQSLRHTAMATMSSPKGLLSDSQYNAGFSTLMQGSGWLTYQEFIIPQLSVLLDPLVNSGVRISVLEVGPGPKSVLGYLPGHLRCSIRRYAAFEPNELFASRLEQWLCSTSKTGFPLPCLESSPDIYRIPFVVDNNMSSSDGAEKFDMILFCHSMYGMKPKCSFIKRALDMVVERPGGGLVVVFHREGALRLDGIACHQTASFPTGITCVADDDAVLDSFAPFIAGYVMQEERAHKAIQIEWRKVCRALGRREEAHPDRLLFSSPDIMATFTRHATALPKLTSQVSSVVTDEVKNRQARLHRPASIVRPTEIRQVQQCVKWALDHGVGLTVIGGGHSGHCLWPHVVSVHMSAFDQVHILAAREEGGSGFLVVAEAGCKSGDIVRKTMMAGLTVPLGARPSVGAGLWLQGGIGHLARLHGLACDAVVGAVVVSVACGRVLCIGRVPRQHRPVDAVRPANEDDLLWAIKGAGTNFGIVISVTFKAYDAPVYSVRKWSVPLSDNSEARLRLYDFDKFAASKSPRTSSVDASLFWDRDKLRLGVTMVESSSTTELALGKPEHTPTPMSRLFGREDSCTIVNGVGLFETEMYMSDMHGGGHSGGKTSSFKRCIFLASISAANVVDMLVEAIGARPSPLCYIHLLQGGGAVCDVAADATAFGCRDWAFACVITGIWARDQDGTEAAQAAIRWVYHVAGKLLPLSSGAYGADLGPDPRDAALAAKAFGPNRPRLVRLKHISDPRNVLAYACPLAKAPIAPGLIILVTGKSCAGKDFCADAWVSVFTRCAPKKLTARLVSISETTKREYAAAVGADVQRLLQDRHYKEQHRAALTAFFQQQLRQRPRLREEHFLRVVRDAVNTDVDVLLITGMRDEALVAAFSHLVPESRLLEVRVQASEETRRARRGCQSSDESGDNTAGMEDYPPSLLFNNDVTGHEVADKFAQEHLLVFLDEKLQQLAHMVRRVAGFPRPGIEFRHVLGMCQQAGGLDLCTSLLQAHFDGEWAKVDYVVCCEAGGFVYASALAVRVGASLALIREAGRLPPPTISVVKCASHMSSYAGGSAGEKRIEMGMNVLPRGASVVVVDDVLATGTMLCAVLQLLDEAGVSADRVNVMVVAEFPIHRGRELLRRRGFGRARIHSLLVLDGA